MSLLSAQDEQVLTQHLSAIDRPVTLQLYTQTIGGSESGLVAKQVLDEIARLNDHITVEEKNFILDVDERAKYGVDQSPAIVLLANGEDTRMRQFGAPTGYEFVGLIEAILIAGTGVVELEDTSKALIAGVDSPMAIQVFSTPTCPHCPRAVVLAHKMAAANPHITSTAIDATEFMDLSRQFRVTGVPKTIVNNEIEILGALPEEAFVRAALGLPDGDGPV